MSNHFAIAAVTETLRSVLTTHGISHVTARPLHNARTQGNQVNLFLYHTAVDAALRNQPVAGPGASLGTALPPPMPLKLYYLLTAYSSDGNDEESHAHILLGKAIRILHDTPLLAPGDIQQATNSSGFLKDSNLHQQVERVRISWQPLSLEEMTKLWTTSQSTYRLSVAYEVSVTLIESDRPGVNPAPVLRRGEADDGPKVIPHMTEAYIKELRLPNGQSAVNLGNVITLKTEGPLTGVKVCCRPYTAAHAKPKPITALVKTGPGGEISFTALLADFPKPGIYALSLAVPSPLNVGEFLSSNELPLAVAAKIISAVVVAPLLVGGAPAKIDLILDVTVDTPVSAGQRVSLLVGAGREIPLTDAIATSTKTLQFSAVLTARELKALAGKRMLRVRVDGVDMPEVRLVNNVPEFAGAQFVVIPSHG